MSFKLWSETESNALAELKPDFGLRSWSALTKDDKARMWKYLEHRFFDGKEEHEYYNRRPYYKFSDSNGENVIARRIYFSISEINRKYKAKTYAYAYLETPSMYSACLDFIRIFMNESEPVVLELLSLYCVQALEERKQRFFYREDNESDKKYAERRSEWEREPFKLFKEDLNEVFSQYGLNVQLTDLGFAPKQDQKITEEVVEPAIRLLAHPQWREVNTLLSDAFKDYGQNTPNGFSHCVTNTVAAVQAFLQILVIGKTGSGEISKLIPQAQSKKIIPDDMFTKEVFKNIESILMKERNETGTSHPKKEYANEKNARLVLNLAMVFFQHCLQNIPE